MHALRRARLLPTIRQLLSSETEASSHSSTVVQGWVKSVRKQKNVSFAIITDGSSSAGLQAVFAKGTIPEGLTNGAAVRLSGQVVGSLGSGQAKEFRVETAEIVGDCDPQEYPIQKQALSTDYLRDNCHLRARADNISSMLRVRGIMSHSIHQFFEEQGFLNVNTPILTSNDCEGAGETFSVVTEDTRAPSTSKDDEFFRKKAFLTVSSQLHLEALCAARSRVYTMSPCFRAERSQTGRHLAEFWMLEAEWAFENSLESICDVVEDVVKTSASAALEHEPSGVDVTPLKLDKDWQRISYTEAIKELEQHDRQISLATSTTPTTKFEFSPKWGRPLQSEHERWLAQSFSCPVFVTDYPKSLKPFYMRANSDGKTVACFDLLVPGVGELAGGSLREERVKELDEAIDAHGLDREEYSWYRDLRRFGGTQHGGFGLGFERFVSAVTGIDNVRECIAMPRWAGRMLL